LKTFMRIIGKLNASTLSLYDLSHRFRLAEIVSKLANIFPDLPYKRLEDSSIFKAVVSGDHITGERKYGNPFTFVPFAKLIFSANRMPTTADISPGFFRRWLIIEFPFSFYGKDRDTRLLSKLTTEEELEGLLMSAIKGLKSLHENGDFQESQGMKDMKAEYERMNNPVAEFIEACCMVDPNVEIEKTKLYEKFREYTVEHKLQSLGRNDFYKELQKQVPSIVDVHDVSRRWRGITRVIRSWL